MALVCRWQLSRTAQGAGRCGANSRRLLAAPTPSRPKDIIPGRCGRTSLRRPAGTVYFGRTTQREAAAASEAVSTSSDRRAAGDEGAGDVAVVIVDHGSRRQASNDMLEQFAEVYQLYTGHEVVEAAHMEIAEPTILQAVAKCVERGAASVVIAPYFLSRGRHIQSDIPALVEEAQAVHPEVKITVADPIGIDQLMVQLIENRVQAAIKS